MRLSLLKGGELVSPESLLRFYRCRPYAVRLPRSLYALSFGEEGGIGQGADGTLRRSGWHVLEYDLKTTLLGGNSVMLV